MKKSLLSASTLLLAAALLAGCGGGGGSSEAASSSSAQGTSSAAVSSTSGETAPTVTPDEGKTAYVVKVTWDGVTLPSYVSIFMTGCMAQVKDADGKLTATWATGLDAIELAEVEGHAGWYWAQSDLYTTATYLANLAEGVADQHCQYQLVLGYNASAEIAEAKKGLQWVDSFKSEYCQSFAFPANPTFDEPGADRVVHLHDDSFNAVPKAPEPPLSNYTIKVAFSVALPEWEVPHFMGSFDGWDTDFAHEEAHRMVPSNEARTIWKYTIDSIMPDTYEVTMSLDYTMESKPDQTAYAWIKPDDWQSGNKLMTINSADGDDFVMDDADAFTADLTNTGVLADPNVKFDYTFIMVNTGTALDDTAQPIYLSGTINSWAADRMTVDETGKVYTLVKNAPAGSYDFAIHNDGWAYKVAGEGGANFSITLEEKPQTVTVTADMTEFSLTANYLAVVGTVVITDTAA
jgi:hypothetical protein